VKIQIILEITKKLHDREFLKSTPQSPMTSDRSTVKVKVNYNLLNTVVYYYTVSNYYTLTSSGIVRVQDYLDSETRYRNDVIVSLRFE